MTMAAIDRRAPYRRDHDASVEAGMSRGAQPKGLPALMRWYAAGWDAEVPMALHRRELWRDHGTQAEGGSLLGTKAWADPFRRYLEGRPDATDEHGSYLLPMHAALHRLSRRWPLTARTLFAVSQAGYDWQAVALRCHWPDELLRGYLEWALAQLWLEHRDVEVRLS